MHTNFFFFFSSRRRHTRLQGDWSSDVCSSDLKQWCTNGDHADVIVVFATIDPKLRAKGVTAFLVERGMPGFAVGKKEKKMGIRASPTVALHFTDCAVPVANRLGEEGEGFTIAMETLDVTRPAT